MEHNAVMRPLRFLESQGLTLTVVPCSSMGFLDPADIEKAIRPETKLVVLNHASNVTGGLLPIAEAGRIARKHGLLLLVDTAQTAGAVPIDMQAENIDLLTFTGHKSLLGPTGTGGLILGERVADDAIQPLILGGTGSRSEEEFQPDFLPDSLESGTPNTAGLAGLSTALQWLTEKGVYAVRQHEVALTAQLINGLKSIPGVTVFGGQDAELQTATVSFNIDQLAPSAVGMRLDAEYGILCRVGLHCAPAAHRTLGTFPDGSVRFGLGIFNTTQQVEQAVQAVAQLASEDV
jgi:selenocysteine lyase/cysteine desulfurase